jgi:hypothetical protein
MKVQLLTIPGCPDAAAAREGVGATQFIGRCPGKRPLLVTRPHAPEEPVHASPSSSRLRSPGAPRT